LLWEGEGGRRLRARGGRGGGEEKAFYKPFHGRKRKRWKELRSLIKKGNQDGGEKGDHHYYLQKRKVKLRKRKGKEESKTMLDEKKKREKESSLER